MEIKGLDKLTEKERGIVERRLKIIEFFDKYGVSATRDGFVVARSTVYFQKKRFKDGSYYVR